jgi:membrane-bound lytic murein transglycosylase B
LLLIAAAVVAVAGALAVGFGVAGDDDPQEAATTDTSGRRTTTTTSSTTTTSTSTTVAPTTTTLAPTTTLPPVPTTLQPIVAGGRPRAAGDPVSLAAQIVEAEAAIRDPASTPEVVDAAGRLAQVAYRVLADRPEWDLEVVSRTPGLDVVLTHNVLARREFRSMHRNLSDTLPAWRIVEPLPADQLLALYQEAEAAYGVPWNVLAAVNLVETGMGRIRGVSVAGAQGPMQFMPATWEAYGMGGDVNDPRDAIMGAANYLAANGGGDGTSEGLDNALWHYNHADAYVRGVRHYADVMGAEPITFRGFHAWEVVYLSTVGDVVLEPGYESAERIPAADYVAANPQ